MIELTIDLTQWIKHDGGGRPVASDQRIEVLFRRGFTESGAAERWHLCWQDSGSQSDIVAYRLTNVTELRQGDCVALDGLSEQHRHDMLAAFLAAGANYHDANNSVGEGGFLFWDRSNDVWVASRRHDEAQRQLTYQQVMNVSGESLGCDIAYFGWDPAKAEEPAEPVAQKWPPVGERVRIVTAEGDQGCADVVAHHNGGCVVWQHSDMEYRRWHREFIRPVRSEEELGTEAIAECIDEYGAELSLGTLEGLARHLYRAGYRRTEAP